MNFQNPGRALPGDLTPLDAMLAEIALRIQLSPTDHGKAVSRYEVVSDWIDRPDSPLHGRVELTYPQGSMAIGATTARSSERDEHDIDAMAQLSLHRDIDPELALSLLERSIRGERGSLYHDMAVRRTRCVTVQYADGMHLDVTPAVLLSELRERTSFIFHSKPQDPRVAKQSLYANPWGFAEWFIARTPAAADVAFADYFEQRSLEEMRLRMLAEAAAEPVPDRLPAYRKSRALIALQLIKRNRNLRYESRPACAARRRCCSANMSRITPTEQRRWRRKCCIRRPLCWRYSSSAARRAVGPRGKPDLPGRRAHRSLAGELPEPGSFHRRSPGADTKDGAVDAGHIVGRDAGDPGRPVRGAAGTRCRLGLRPALRVTGPTGKGGAPADDRTDPGGRCDARIRARSGANHADPQVLRRRTGMTWLSVREQDQRIRAVFPNFELTLNASWMGVWQGSLTPIMRRYRIRVTYFRRASSTPGRFAPTTP